MRDTSKLISGRNRLLRVVVGGLVVIAVPDIHCAEGPFFRSDQPVTIRVWKEPYLIARSMKGCYADLQKLIAIKENQSGFGSAAIIALVAGSGAGNLAAQHVYKENAEGTMSRYQAVVEPISLDLKIATRQVIAERLHQPGSPQWILAEDAPPDVAKPSPGQPELIFFPYILFKVEKDGTARLWIELAAGMRKRSGKVTINAAVYVQAEGVRPLAGPESWTSNERLEQSVGVGLRRAFDLWLNILASGKFDRDGKEMRVSGHFPTMDFSVTALFLRAVSEDKDEWVGCLEREFSQGVGYPMFFSVRRSDFTFKEW